jgi:hypothetical protein
VKGCRHGQGDDREHQHAAVRAGRRRIVVHDVVAPAAQQEGDAEREQHIGQDRANQRRADHLDQTRPQCHDTDDQLR